MNKEQIKQIKNEYKDKSPQEILKFAISEFGDHLKIASSLGVEDQVIRQC